MRRASVIDANAVLSVARKCICQEGIDAIEIIVAGQTLPASQSMLAPHLLSSRWILRSDRDKRLTCLNGELDFVDVAHRIDCAPKARRQIRNQDGSYWSGSRAIVTSHRRKL